MFLDVLLLLKLWCMESYNFKRKWREWLNVNHGIEVKFLVLFLPNIWYLVTDHQVQYPKSDFCSTTCNHPKFKAWWIRTKLFSSALHFENSFKFSTKKLELCSIRLKPRHFQDPITETRFWLHTYLSLSFILYQNE